MIRRLFVWLGWGKPSQPLPPEFTPPELCRHCGKSIEPTAFDGLWAHTYYSFTCFDPEPLIWE